jgi:hypothetical protein
VREAQTLPQFNEFNATRTEAEKTV